MPSWNADALYSDMSVQSHVPNPESQGLKWQHFPVHKAPSSRWLGSVAIVTSSLFYDTLMVTEHMTMEQRSGCKASRSVKHPVGWTPNFPAQSGFLRWGRKRVHNVTIQHRFTNIDCKQHQIIVFELYFCLSEALSLFPILHNDCPKCRREEMPSVKLYLCV